MLKVWVGWAKKQRIKLKWPDLVREEHRVVLLSPFPTGAGVDLSHLLHIPEEDQWCRETGHLDTIPVQHDQICCAGQFQNAQWFTSDPSFLSSSSSASYVILLSSPQCSKFRCLRTSHSWRLWRLWRPTLVSPSFSRLADQHIFSTAQAKGCDEILCFCNCLLLWQSYSY